MVETPNTRASLLIRLRDLCGDERAWSEFVDIYEPFVLELAYRRGLRGADADDLAQEVFVAVAAAIARRNLHPARGSFRGWLFGVARNLTVDLLAAQHKQPRGTGETRRADGRLEGSSDRPVLNSELFVLA